MQNSQRNTCVGVFYHKVGDLHLGIFQNSFVAEDIQPTFSEEYLQKIVQKFEGNNKWITSSNTARKMKKSLMETSFFAQCKELVVKVKSKLARLRSEKMALA